MAYISVENAWVQFLIPKGSVSDRQHQATGGQIDASQGVITALEDISFKLRDGDRLGLIGHNGAGKSTMLRLSARVYEPTRGRILTRGRISTLFTAAPGLDQEGTGRENIITCGLHLGMSYQQIRSKLDEIIDFSELGDFIDMPVRTYSSGMTTRLGFSIATSVEPEILLLDEGLATGDARFAKKAKDRMNTLMQRAAILVVASHSETLISDLCERALLIEHGKIVSDTTPQSLLETYHTRIVEQAAMDDDDNRLRAYKIATDLQKNGKPVPPPLEEQALRYALSIDPDDPVKIARFFAILDKQTKRLPANEEFEWLARGLGIAPERRDFRGRLVRLIELHGDEIGAVERERADRLLILLNKPQHGQ